MLAAPLRVTVAIAAGLSLPAPLGARLSIAVKAGTDLRVSAGPNGQSIAAGTDVTNGFSLHATTSAQCLGQISIATASSALAVHSAPQRVGCTFDNSASMSVWCAGPYASAGRHTLLVTLTASQPTYGRLRLNGSGGGSGYSFSIKEAGGSTAVVSSEIFRLEHEVEIPALVDASGTAFELTAYATNANAFFSIFSIGSGVANLELDFRADGGGKIARIGTPCGPTLDGRYERAGPFTPLERFELRAAGSPAWPAPFFVFGLADPNLPIPPTGCPLRTDILVAIPAALGPAGEAMLPLDVPARVTKLDLRTQFVVGILQGGVERWRTSEALRLRLP